ncbi:MAG: creatininase family protein [Acidobacteriaceae bacterium]
MDFTRRDVLRTGVFVPAAVSAAISQEITARDEGQQPKRLEEVAGFRLGDEVAAHRLTILPLGSIEYHGPHNPLGVDSIIISGIAEKVALRTKALLLPTIFLTQCPAHTAYFRGTFSIRPEVMTMYFADVLRNMVGMGFKRIFVLNGHDGNIGPGRGAIAEIAHEVQDSAILFASWWEFLPGEMVKTMGIFSQSNGGHGHGGPLETSAVAAFRPDLIHLDKSADLPQPPDLSGGTPYFLQKSVTKDWPGYSGKISEASAEKGRRLVKISEDGIVKLVENWLSNPEAPGSW